ncbi:MAG: flippase [Nanoarchaeota archaeon]
MDSLPYMEKIVKGAFLVLFSMVFGKLFSYLYVVLVAIKLGSHDYGLLSLGLAVLSFSSALALMGLDEGILRFIPFYNGKNNQALVKNTLLISLKTVLNSSLFIAVLLIVFSDFISSRIFDEYELTKVILFIAIALPFSTLLQLILVSFRAFQKPEYEVLFKELTEKSLRLIITFILITLGFKLYGALLGFVLSIIIVFFLSLFAFNKKIFSIFSREIKEKENKKELLNYSLPLMLKNFMWFIIAWTDLLMIGYFKTTSDVGIYNVALPTSTLIIVPIYGIMYLFMPIISELYGKNNLDQISDIYKKVSKYSLLLNIPIFLIIFLLSKDLVLTFFRSEYISAALPLTILSIGYLVFSLSDISMNLLSVIKKTKTIFIIIAIFALSNIILNYFLIPKYSIVGASIATSLSFFIGAILMMLTSYKFTKLHPFMFNYVKIFIALILTLVLTLIFKNYIKFSSEINLIITSLFILVVYSSLVYLLKILDKDDLDLIKDLKNKISKKFLN